MAGAASPRQQAKLHKKLSRKEQEHEVSEESARQTRRRRFVNPDKPFGKSSLVYQLKYGVLKDEVPLDSLQEPVRPRPRDDYRTEPPTPRHNFRDADGSPTKDDRQKQLFTTERSRESDVSTRSRHPRRSSSAEKSREGQPNHGRQGSTSDRYKTRETHDRRATGDGDLTGLASSLPRKMMPIAIKYTTAASQFLYGRSVVQAALEHCRRKIYNLYIYGGENRVDSSYNAAMIRLAESQGVPVTIVPNEQQRLMDKMSLGRPHNGFVLETSPIPQIPVTALGKVEDAPGRYGFQIARGHQTREEEAINGTSTFIRRKGARTTQPLVLLVHEIMDPGNLGALLRTASYLGVEAVGITSRSSSTLTPVVLKSAAGAVEEISIFTVDSPTEFITRSQSAGWTAYAAVAPPEEKLARMHENKFMSTDDIEEKSPLLTEPCIVVLGNEGHGLPRAIKMAADYELSIPRVATNSSIDSLNVSVAGALLCHAFVKGVKPKGKPARMINPFEEFSKPKSNLPEGNGAEKLF